MTRQSDKLGPGDSAISYWITTHKKPNKKYIAPKDFVIKLFAGPNHPTLATDTLFVKIWGDGDEELESNLRFCKLNLASGHVSKIEITDFRKTNSSIVITEVQDEVKN